jgi:hypothetical protein
MRLARLAAPATLTLALLAAPLAAEAQQAVKVYRIGWLHPQPLPKQWLAGFDQGLREFGYVEGKDLVIERMWGDGNFDRLPAMAAELVRLKVDVLISGNTRALREFQKATRTIPIVMLGPGDPLGGPRRQPGAAGCQHHGTIPTGSRAQWEAAGATQGSRAEPRSGHDAVESGQPVRGDRPARNAGGGKDPGPHPK